MKILLITSIYPTKQHPDYGTFVKNIHEIYEELGHEVTLVTYSRSGGKLDKLKEIRRFYSAIHQALQHHEEFDLINLHYPFLAALPVSHNLKSLSIPLIVSVHGSDVFPDSLSKRAFMPSTRRILMKSSRIIVPSAFFGKKLMKTWGLPEDQIRVAPPGGYDGSLFYPTDKIFMAAGEKKKGFKDPGRLMGFAGRLTEGKGWKILLEAFASSCREPAMKDFALVLAGSGADAEKILEHAGELAILPRVKLVGPLQPEGMADFYRSLDLFIFPTLLEESLGMVGLEAMASGVPVIASGIGGIREYMTDGVNGRLVPPGDADALAEAMLDLAGLDEARYSSMAEAAHRSALAYERKSVGLRLDQILQEVMR